MYGSKHSLQIPRRSYGDIVRGQQKVKSRRHAGKLCDGGLVSIQIGFRTIKKNWAGIVGIAGEQQSILPIKQGDGVWRMSGSSDHLQHASADVNGVAVMDPVAYLKRPRGIGFCLELRRQSAAKLAWRNLRLRIGTRTFSTGACEGCIHAVNLLLAETPVVAHVIIVGV